MNPTRQRRLKASTVIWPFVALSTLAIGLFIGLNIGTDRSPGQSPLDLTAFRVHKDGVEETSRTTDPTNQFDAVLLTWSYGGAVGGTDWFVSLVRKGQPGTAAKEAVFLATSADNVSLVWRQAHLLEIHYKVAEILGFSNLWWSDSIQTRFSTKDPYYIEIKLVPSDDFSILRPNGDFR